MKILSRNSMMMLLLAVVFLAPGLAAIYFYQHPQWLMGHPTNKGEFVKPSIKIKSLNSSVLESHTVEKKWHLVLWSPSGCTDECIRPLDQLVRIRLSLGRHFYEVEPVLLTGPHSEPESSLLLDLLQKNKLLFVQLPVNEASKVYVYA